MPWLPHNVAGPHLRQAFPHVPVPSFLFLSPFTFTFKKNFPVFGRKSRKHGISMSMAAHNHSDSVPSKPWRIKLLFSSRQLLRFRTSKHSSSSSNSLGTHWSTVCSIHGHGGRQSACRSSSTWCGVRPLRPRRHSPRHRFNHLILPSILLTLMWVSLS